MKNHQTKAMKPKTRLLLILLTAVALLSVPLIAMQFTNEVQWTVSDFVVAGILLLGAGLVLELILRTIKKTAFRILTIAILLLVFLLIWAELAVGIFGTPFAGS